MTLTPTQTRQSASAFAFHKTEPPTLSIVVPVHDEYGVLAELYRRVREVMEPSAETWELILVDDGSHDGSSKQIEHFCAQDWRVRGIRLTRNFGFQLAVTAGLGMTRSQAVVIMDADLQDPPEVIPEMITKWRSGFDVVYGVRSERAGETWFKRSTASAFYRLIHNITNVNIPLDTGDFRLMDRRMVEAIQHLPEKSRFLRGMVSWVGFQQTGVPYKREPRFAGESKFTFKKMLTFALDAITGFSYLPLQLASYLGGLVTLVGLLSITIIGVLRLLDIISTLPGLPLGVSVLVFLGGIQLICLGILGEYLGRIYEEVKHRPLYLVAQRWGFDDPTL